MRNVLSLIAVLILATACQAPHGDAVSDTGDQQSASRAPAAVLDEPIADLTGRWVFKGDTCGDTFNPANHSEGLTFATGEVVVDQPTVCGTRPIEFYALAQTAHELSMTLTRSWSTGHFIQCPGTNNVVPSAPTNVYTYQVVGKSLSVVEGTCSGGLTFTSYYEKE